MEKEIYSRA